VTISTVGSGLGATFALVEETSYAVVKASPTWQFYEPSALSWKKVKNTKQSAGFAAGRVIKQSQRRVVTSQAATASTTFEVCQTGFTRLLNLMSGSYAVGNAGSQAAANGIWSAGARLQPATPMFGYTHTWRNSIAGRSCALQMGVPTTDGVLRQKDLLGVKPTKMTFSCKKDDFLMLAVEWDARVLGDPLVSSTYPAYPNGAGQTPYVQAAPSYSIQLPYHFAEAQIQIGASTTAASSAALADGVTEFSLVIENKLNTGRFYYGNAGYKDEQIRSEEATITGTIVSDYVNKTFWDDVYYSDTAQSALVTFSAGALVGTNPAIQFALNNIFENDGTPSPSNKDVVSTSYPFEALYDGTNEPLSVIIQTADATG